MEAPIVPESSELSWSAIQQYLDKVATVCEKCKSLLPTLSNVDLNISSFPFGNIRSGPTLEQQETKKNVLNTLIECSKGVKVVYIKMYQRREEFVTYLIDKKLIHCWTGILCYLNRMGIFRDDDVYTASELIWTNLWNFTDVNAACGAAVAESGGMLPLYENICICRYLGGAFEENKKLNSILLCSLSTIHNIVRRPGNAKYFDDSWKPTLLELINVCKEQLPKLLAIFILAYKSNESEDDVITQFGGVMRITLGFLHLTLRNEDHKFIGFSADELLDVLAVLTVQYKMKHEFVQNGGISIIKRTCNPNCMKEMRPSTKIFCNLVLNKEIRENLKENHDLLSFLEEIHAASNVPDDVIKNIEAILWMIGGQKREVNKPLVSKSSRVSSAPAKGLFGTRDIQKRHEQQLAPLKSMKTQECLPPCVFISYTRENREIVHRIYRALDERGISCWIDQDHMEGSTIDAMAEGIQSAKVVVVCISSAYKLSHWGKMEADYAVKLKKIIIPTILEYRYKPDGWLGFILGDKKYYEFSERHDFDEVFYNFYKAIHKCSTLS